MIRDSIAGRDRTGILRMADHINLHDWTATSLGGREVWTQNLRTTIDIMLGSGHAMCVAWGEELTFLYNDAFAPFLGARHPRALGMTFAEVWPDVWADISPLVDRVFMGETTTIKAMPLVMTRNGYAEETWWDFSYSPIRDETGQVAGLLNVASDATTRILAERERDAALSNLRASEAVSRENIQRVQLALSAGAIIGTWFWDIAADRFTIDEPFAKAFGLDPALGREGIPLAQIVSTVHPDDQEGLARAIGEAVARGGGYAHQYRTRRLDGNYYWLEANGRVDHAPDGTPISFPGVLIDIEERRAGKAERDRIAAELRDSEEFMRSVLTSSNDCIEVLDLDANLIFMSEGGQRALQISDFDEIAGSSWIEFWEDAGKQAAREAIATACAGHATSFQAYANTLMGNRRYWDVQVSPILGADGRPKRILSVLRDVTAQKASEEARILLTQEMAHRMKNTLAMVQAVVTQTLRQATSMDSGRLAVSQRLTALGRAQDILTRSDFTEADVEDVVDAAINPHRIAEDRISWAGPHFGLTAQQALGLSLAIHELATNAAKYGALSNDVGRVEMSWKSSNGAFEFSWSETGGPSVSPPDRRGFGSKLIENIVASYFDGEGFIDFDPSGITFMLKGATNDATTLT